jgi:uncharacterized repeat protein (TIGR01451 family)
MVEWWVRRRFGESRERRRPEARRRVVTRVRERHRSSVPVEVASRAVVQGTARGPAGRGVVAVTSFRPLRLGASLGIIVGAAALLLASAAPSPAVVPGSNGKLAFDGSAGIGVVPPTGGTPAPVRANGFSPAWSPDGNRLVFARRLPGPCAPCSYELVVLDLVTDRETKIFEGTTFDPAPAWSPDGRTIAFVNQLDGFDDLWLVNSDGSSPRRLTFSRNNGAPAWSPDGTLIAFSGIAERSDLSYEIYVVRPDGSGERALTRDRAFDVEPSWSPDGSTLAFASTRGAAGPETPVAESLELYAMDADGSAIRALTSGAKLCPTGAQACRVRDAGTAWSPDGTQIAFTSHRDGPSSAVYVMNRDGSNQRRVGPPSSTSPDWQPTVELSISASGPRRARVGRRATFSLAITNSSPRTSTAVSATVTLPRGATFVGASPSRGRCTGGRRVRCALGHLGADERASVDVRVRIRRAGRLRHVAAVRGVEADANEANNRATTVTRALRKK